MGVKIIAEAGVNHNGEIELAKELIFAAAEAGVDVVKFQTFNTSEVLCLNAEKADYQKLHTGDGETQYEMVKRLELSYEMHHELLDTCNKCNVEFLSTAFDHGSLDFLLNKMKLQTLKIPSGEITNGPFILSHARSNCDIILSTGMSSIDEIEAALAILAYGILKPSCAVASLDECVDIFALEEAKSVLSSKVTLLHCTSQYPAPANSVNILAIKTLQEAFGMKVGYSDHTEGYIAAVAAVTLGATIIEKHFTLDKNLKGPDHKASVEPYELKIFVENIRQAEIMRGGGVKVLQECEKDTLSVARKSLVAKCAILKDEKFTQDNISILRPGTGISPMRYWEYLHKTANRAYEENEIIVK